MRLNQQARAELQDANIKPSLWPRLHGQEPGSTWDGDACGCPDDRCIGYHHDSADACRCLPVLIEEHWKNLSAGEEGQDVWALHEHAIATYHPMAVTYGLTERGITCRNQYSDHTWLVFDAKLGQVSSEQLD